MAGSGRQKHEGTLMGSPLGKQRVRESNAKSTVVPWTKIVTQWYEYAYSCMGKLTGTYYRHATASSLSLLLEPVMSIVMAGPELSLQNTA
ncbi:unnamed protein product [Clonostachys rhizophaga]|uniref:Uncharacterized protein n=1 Tax=Clonostachys rhizophaga TaxID=160324 RepID=A0A9N9YCR5_9HYPO|nr:unnamed protein product [Clonostachys rhizophaga]